MESHLVVGVTTGVNADDVGANNARAHAAAEMIDGAMVSVVDHTNEGYVGQRQSQKSEVSEPRELINNRTGRLYLSD